MGDVGMKWRDPLGSQGGRRLRPPLSLCTAEWVALRHGRPKAKGVTQRSESGAEARPLHRASRTAPWMGWVGALNDVERSLLFNFG